LSPITNEKIILELKPVRHPVWVKNVRKVVSRHLGLKRLLSTSALLKILELDSFRRAINVAILKENPRGFKPEII